MDNLIGIVNYGIAGNTHSVKKAIERAGGNAILVNSPSDFNLIDKVIIPGVGSFNGAMQELGNNGCVEPLKIFTKPILGICLGMQILAKLGFEYGKTKGLGLVDAEVKIIQCDGRVPHMGFNKIQVVKPNILFNGLEEEKFYFMHSYEMVNYTDIVALTEYKKHIFVSSVCKNNIYGVQFHPEKSREVGIKLLSNFIKLKA